MFPYRSPLDREFIANLIKNLEAKGKTIGLDILLDSPTEKNKDEYFKNTIEIQKFLYLLVVQILLLSLMKNN